MKLSTYTKGFRKFYSSESCWTQYLCVALDCYTTKLKNKTKNPKLHEEYFNHRILCKQFIASAIENCHTVVEYLNKQGIDLKKTQPFRLNLLNDMVDWAESQEQSHQM